MKKKIMAKIAIISTLSLFIGIASIALAADTPDDASKTEETTVCPYHQNMRGMHKFRNETGRIGAMGDLTEEQVEKLKAARSEFQKATQDLRQELKSKQLALQSELVKKEPDAKKAKTLQKEISELNAELGQKRIEHKLEMKKIAPYGAFGQMPNDGQNTRMGRGRRQT